MLPYYVNILKVNKMDNTNDVMALCFLQAHLVMVLLEPRCSECSVVEGKYINPANVKALALACWTAIIAHDLQGFAAVFKVSFNAQIAMSPTMVNPVINGQSCPEASV